VAVVQLVFLPGQVVFLSRANGAVLQALRVITGKDELHRGKKGRNELGLLVDDALANAMAQRGAAVF